MLSLILKLKTLLVLMISMIERRITNGTVEIHLPKLMPYIFFPVTMPNLFSILLKTFSSIEHVKVFPTLIPLVISGI